MRRVVAGAVGVLLLGPCGLHAQSQPAAPASSDDGDHFKLRASVELKANARWSEDDRFVLAFRFAPDFVPVGQPNVALRTVSPGSSLEVSRALLNLDAELPHQIAGHVQIGFINLYDRNPTSKDHTVDVREAWVAFGKKHGSLEPLPEAKSFYALFGKAPKLERQPFRRLDSYGLVSTAFNRFNDLQLQVGGSLGTHVYFAVQLSNGNPMFMRDPNALAGDNGTDPPPNPDPNLNSGFPILYDAEVEELAGDGRMEWGGALGARFLSADQARGVDVMGYYYKTRLSEAAKLRGTFYEGDLDILDGAGGISLPIHGDEREEYGADLDARLGGLSLWAQLVHQDAAGLPRTGFELEAGYRIRLGDLADAADLFPSVQPAIRYSHLGTGFSAPSGFVAPSFAWDWSKLDLGVRVTIVRRLDLTLEYAFHDIGASRPIKHDEALATLRLAF
jgi:hypothetical protein